MRAAGLAAMLTLLAPACARPAFASGAPARPATPADCEALEGARADEEPYRCFQALVRRSFDTWTSVDRHLRARVLRDAGDRTARLALALLARDRGDPRAEALLRGAAEAMHLSGDARGEVAASRALIPLLSSQGRLAEAEEALGAAGRAARSSGQRDLQASVTLLTAGLAQRRFQHDRALRLLKETEPSIFPDGPPWLQSAALSSMGGALWGLGRFREAAEHYRRQLEMVRAAGDRYQEADTLNSLALASSRAGGFTPESSRLTREALAAALASANPWAEVSARMSLAQVPGQPVEQRIDQIERALVVLRRTRDLGNSCFALRELARWLQDVPGGIERAFQAADEAVRLARQAGDRFHLARGLLRRWNLDMVHSPRERALASGFEALDAIEAVRNLQRDEDARARVLAEWVFVYQQLIGFLLEPPAPGSEPSGADLGRAFMVTERLRAQELLAALDGAGSTALLGRQRPEHAPRQAVLDEIARTQQRLLDAALAADDRARLLRELEALEVRERALRDRIASADAGFATARSPRLATVEEIRQELAPDQALLSYVLRQRPTGFRFERPRVFVLTRDAARMVTLPDAAANPLRSVAGLSGLVARRDGSEAEGAARMHRLLVQDAVALLPASITRLVVIPDAALHRVPFDALRANGAAATVAERYEVTVVPSASLWLRLRTRRGRPGGALALADPHWPGRAAAATERQAPPWERLVLGGLPRGRSEARLALRSLTGAGRVLTGAQATERFLKTADLRAYSLLHLAAHAVVDDDNPERSAIVLAPGAREEDGLLQSREIVGLDLSGLVIVLSACRSSSGEVVAGEGPLTLARAFLQAGARAVIGNLWEVRDDEAGDLMAAFYRELAGGRSVAAALAAARRERLRSGAPAAAWAGTVVLGDGDATLVAPGRKRRDLAAVWLPAAVAAACVAFPLALWWRRRNAAG